MGNICCCCKKQNKYQDGASNDLNETKQGFKRKEKMKQSELSDAQSICSFQLNTNPNPNSSRTSIIRPIPHNKIIPIIRSMAIQKQFDEEQIIDHHQQIMQQPIKQKQKQKLIEKKGNLTKEQPIIGQKELIEKKGNLMKEQHISGQKELNAKLLQIQNQNKELFQKLKNQRFSDLKSQKEIAVLSQYLQDSFLIGKYKLQHQQWTQAKNLFYTYLFLNNEVFKGKELPNTALCNIYLGNIYFKQKQYLRCLHFYQDGFNIYKKDSTFNQENQSWSAQVFQNIADSLFQFQKYQQSLNFYKKSIQNLQKKKTSKKTMKFAQLLNKKGLAQIHTGKYKESIETNKQCLQIKYDLAEQKRDKLSITNYGNMSNAYFLMEEHFQECVDTCQQAIDICIKQNYKGVDYAKILYCKGSAYFKNKNYVQAKDILEQAGNIFWQQGNPIYIQIYYKVLLCCKQLKYSQEQKYYNDKFSLNLPISA